MQEKGETRAGLKLLFTGFKKMANFSLPTEAG